ncbi:hypothetical protein DQC13_25980 [Salmonella enterica subsp. enterica serovar Gatow]|uniref:Uncharacterized protein n=1 Tax=Salmonella enterica subsp. enterica serovar Java TaxID=224729 RepID=A0A3Y9C5J9_SALEB|nr:hypothetical protein [Salmonella enterica subsp. enterica serovar Java]EBW7255875.1 hypothetical protein [Salmonella enterica subsp. enterica serovar Gatow]MIP06431.1 hypothetical protein [Salmonella enterica subsp. enterica serovar Oranienburg]
MFEKGRHDLREYFSNEMNSLRYFIRTPVSQAFRQMQKQLSATTFVVELSWQHKQYTDKI